MIRLILARHVTKRGAPGSEQLLQSRARQTEQITGPLVSDVAAVVRKRLDAYPKAEGIDALDDVIQPVTSNEALSSKVPAGTPVPDGIRRKVNRCLSDTADALVERGIITSGETLARVIPQFSSEVRASAFIDPHLRRLYAAIYRAFRQRRSLLLLNLEKQIQLEELPWIGVIGQFRDKNLSSSDLSRRTLNEVASLTLRSFPQAIIPNKLIQEFSALAKGAEWNLALLEELAADIFMGDLSPKFTAGAKQAAEKLDGSLYARYYGLDCSAIRQLPATKLAERWPPSRSEYSNQLVRLCAARASVGMTPEWSVARNGMIIEQIQIITTHNLSVLFHALGLAEELKNQLHEMATQCFRWICKRLQMKSSSRHTKLIAVKNTAYAWRQMIFYLSHLHEAEVQSFLTWANQHLRKQNAFFQSRFEPVLRGLVTAHNGQSLDDPSQEGECYRFLGWTTSPHRLLE